MMSPWEDKEFAELSLINMDNKFLAVTEKEVDFIIKELELIEGDSIIDLGCGAGRHSIELAKKGFEITGIDISDTMLTYANKRALEAGVSDSINFIKGNLAELDKVLDFKYYENSFDAALCMCESGFSVLGGLDKDIEFLKNIHKLIKPNKKVVVTMFNGLRRYVRYKEGNTNFDYISGKLIWKGPERDGIRLEEVQRLYIPSEVIMLFKLAGFRDIKIYGCEPGKFEKQKLNIDDIEMMVIATK